MAARGAQPQFQQRLQRRLPGLGVSGKGRMMPLVTPQTRQLRIPAFNFRICGLMPPVPRYSKNSDSTERRPICFTSFNHRSLSIYLCVTTFQLAQRLIYLLNQLQLNLTDQYSEETIAGNGGHNPVSQFEEQGSREKLRATKNARGVQLRTSSLRAKAPRSPTSLTLTCTATGPNVLPLRRGGT